MLIINLIKWLFIFFALWLSYYFYTSENSQISTISHETKNPKLVSILRKRARLKMGLLLLIFTSFITWMLSYDFVVEEINKRNLQLTLKLEQASKIYENLSENQKRLMSEVTNSEEYKDSIHEYYTEIMSNYYVMKKCDIAKEDDIFIINSAMMREISLNNISFSLRTEILKDAKQIFTGKYIGLDCSEIHGKHNEIIRNYQKYIISTREILRGTF